MKRSRNRARPCGSTGLASRSNSMMQGNRIWSLRLLKADGASWRSGAINSDRGCRNGEEPASVRSFARSKGSSASNHLPNFSYAIALAGRVDAFTCSVGTGGTLAGVAFALKEKNPNIRIVLADPMGSALYHYYAHGELKAEGTSITEGIGQGRVTGNLEGAPIDDWVQ